MIHPQKNSIVRGFFKKYLPYIISKNFRAVNFNEVDIDAERSILLIANHFSWWDAFLMYHVFSKLTGKQFHVMVLEETMKQQWFFKYIGAFSVGKGPHDVITSLNYAEQLLNDPENLVLIFPQGKLYSNFIDEVHFEKGVLKIMEQAANKFQLIYSAAFIECFQHKKPSINVYLNIPTSCTFDNIDALTNSYNQHYNTARQHLTKTVL